MEAVRCGLSYIAARLSPPAAEHSLEVWLTVRFGRRLYETFFKTYTEKVWGIPCSQIGAEWASQRIRGLSIPAVLKNALFTASTNGIPKTLIQEFDYPKKGPGMMWTRTRELIEKMGSEVRTSVPVERISWEPGRITSVRAGGRCVKGDEFISSLAIQDLINHLDPEHSRLATRSGRRASLPGLSHCRAHRAGQKSLPR